ncbi:DNA phosphorothioation-dependent restriction protein DptF [Peribacillus frigoritolerans]|uniref:DNA phosphorothioation-dependent restriction protein DptF n=1 Tax=Peribacillus frigoritolerans TaxID=450367 RepID=UPI00228052F9|nr:DNA phosphorothioation-dependent restriction protein DptF [Peribacillus frigoritolerans]MCY9138067.1 DNA phosphorothioation-dependent restriction protein DptF [Peribacillus frigoritolerans]
MQNNNFGFLEGKFPKLAEIGRQIEDVFYNDPQTVLIKGRIFSEELLKEIAKQHEELENINYLKLVERIQLLEEEEILTKDIARSFDTIRYLGNKGTHKFIDNDMENAFKMHKRLFEVSVWFMELYGDYSFVAQKYKYPQPKSDLDIFSELEEKTSSLEKKLDLILTASKAAAATVETESEVPVNRESAPQPNLVYEKEISDQFEFTLKEGDSYLLKELSKLKESSQEAIENSNQFSGFKEYLHVKRSIQDDLEQALNRSVSRNQAQLIFLCGSVGDGKSHLLAYLKNKYPDLVNQFMIHNDATESFDPQKSSLDTLAEILKPFSDDKIKGAQDKLILAINLGVLNNFMESAYALENFKVLSEFIKAANVFETSTITENKENDNFHLISFSDYQPFELTVSGSVSEYYSTLLERLVNNTEENPFYRAYLRDKDRIKGFFITNYELLMLPEIREGIVDLLIQAIIKHKMIISTRSLLNFIHDIMVPANQEVDYINSDAVQKTEGLLPYLLFEGRERSHLLSVISALDPIHKRTDVVDQILIELNNSLDIKDTFHKYIDLSALGDWTKEIESVGAFHELTESSRHLYNKALIRLAYFLANEVKEVFVDSDYKEYLLYLYHFNTGSRNGLKRMNSLLKESIFLWNGRPKNDYVYIDKSNQNIQVAQLLPIKPYFGHLVDGDSGVLNRFHLTVRLALGDMNGKNPIFLEIDYPLYEMFVKLSKGYRPNKKDKEDCIQFVEFIDKVMQHGNREKELLFVNLQSNKSFKLIFDDVYEEFTFRRD